MVRERELNKLCTFSVLSLSLFLQSFLALWIYSGGRQVEFYMLADSRQYTKMAYIRVRVFIFNLSRSLFYILTGYQTTWSRSLSLSNRLSNESNAKLHIQFISYKWVYIHVCEDCQQQQQRFAFMCVDVLGFLLAFWEKRKTISNNNNKELKRRQKINHIMLYCLHSMRSNVFLELSSCLLHLICW